MSFHFKQFSISQNQTAMKVGTDGVLLGAWAHAGGSTALDIGTGTGLLALMLAQRNPDLMIDAIEVDQSAAEEAQINFESSPWSNRLKVFQTSIQEYTPEATYDVIICNPPYFINSTKAPESSRKTARHNDSLTHPELCAAVQRLLSENGSFQVILPVEEARQFIPEAGKHFLHLNRRCIVTPKPGSTPKRWLLEFSFRKSQLSEESITIETEKRHEYSKDYLTLTKDFYLKF
ncbi:MAG: methyltransferase [Flavobacteriales bacterium]|nr:methyltransferase [Flavobacteriales bacterium]